MFKKIILILALASTLPCLGTVLPAPELLPNPRPQRLLAMLQNIRNKTNYSLEVQDDRAHTISIAPGETMELGIAIPSFPNWSIKLPNKDIFKIGYIDFSYWSKEQLPRLDQETKAIIEEGLKDFTAQEYAALSEDDKKLLREGTGIHIEGIDRSQKRNMRLAGAPRIGKNVPTKLIANLFILPDALYIQSPSPAGAIAPWYHRATLRRYPFPQSGRIPFFNLIVKQDGELKVEWESEQPTIMRGDLINRTNKAITYGFQREAAPGMAVPAVMSQVTIAPGDKYPLTRTGYISGGPDFKLLMSDNTLHIEHLMVDAKPIVNSYPIPAGTTSFDLVMNQDKTLVPEWKK